MRAMLLVLLLGCGGTYEPRSICEEAEDAFLGCGVSVPLVNDGPCAGLRHSAAECIMEHASSCLELAKLTRRPDTCFDMLIEPPEIGEPSEPLFPEGGDT
jgi:hypothetical protein